MKKIVFFTLCSDKYKYLLPKVANSFKYFHPDIPHIIYGQEEIDRVKKQYDADFGWIYANVGAELSKEYEIVVQLDSDSIVLDRLVEIIEGDYELGSVLNNNPFEPFGAWLPEINPSIDPKIIVNAGLVAVAKSEFWGDWINMNVRYKNNPDAHWQEQDTLNILFHSGKYRTQIFDGKRGDYGTPERYYGTSSRHQWHMYKTDGKGIYLNEKPVRLLHEAGGNNAEKLDVKNMFSPPVLQRVEEIIA